MTSRQSSDTAAKLTPTRVCGQVESSVKSSVGSAAGCSGRDDDGEEEVSIESRNSYAYAACCHKLLALDPACPRLVASVAAARDPNFSVTLLCDNTDRRVAWHNGVRLEYWVERSESAVATEGKPELFRKLVLSAGVEGGGRDAIEAFLEDALVTYQGRTGAAAVAWATGRDVPLYAWDGEAWCRTGVRRARGLDTLFLPFGVAEDVVDDLTAFLEQAKGLEALHVSPVRTYMFHGTPGSGKTSLVHCLASALRYGIATLAFAPGTTDADVVSSLVRLPPRCFLVIEDVDCAFSGRDSKNHGVTFGTVLAALDGAHSRAPVAAFMTTNRLFELDPALRRRVDHVLEFKTATHDQLHRMFRAFFPDGDAARERLGDVWDLARDRASASTLQKYFVKVRQAAHLAHEQRMELLRTLIDCAGGAGRGGGPTHMYG